MKQRRPIQAVLALMAMAALPASGQSSIIPSFSQNGILVCSNLAPGSVAVVEWSPTASGPWTNNWTGLNAVTVVSNGTVSMSVPMYYRVRGTNYVPPNMALIPAGSFAMGNTFTGEGNNGELPLHTVQVSAFYMDKYEVTKALWDEVKAWNGGNSYSYDNPGSGKATNHPVHTVSWYDVVKWCNARSQKEGKTPCYYADAGLTTIYRTGGIAPFVKWDAEGYRLPTEAEWEKAARGGASGKRFPWGDTITHSLANYYSSTEDAYDISPTRGYHPTFATDAEPYTSPVGYFAPNGYGLYDVVGNIVEWCWDWHDPTWYANALATAADTPGPTTGPNGTRVLRVGQWNFYASTARCATRYAAMPSYANHNAGFRCVRRL